MNLHLKLFISTTVISLTIIGMNISIVCWRDKENKLIQNKSKTVYQVELGFVEKYFVLKAYFIVA